MSSSRFEVERVTSPTETELQAASEQNEDINNEEYIVISANGAPTADLDPSPDQAKEPIKGRFHVEFVEPEKLSECPASPNHNSHHDTHDSHTRTYYQKTFGHNTQEAIPMVAYYHNTGSISKKSSRPTLDQLHADLDDDESALPKPNGDGVEVKKTDQTEPHIFAAPVKFGWIKGVLIRCMLNIWGVMLFLRLSWVVGQAGIGFSLLIIGLSCVVTIITTMSMSAICTNGQVRGGGAYYLISRSLGPEFGGAIGLIFSLANAVAVAMYVVGFSETVVELMFKYNATMTGNLLNDIRIVGTITVIMLLGITQLGMAWEAKMQMALLVILLISILNFLIGTFIPVDTQKMSFGIFNYQGNVAAENFGPQFRNNENFFSVFSIFFPAATGILAGCNISGDLKNAQTAIPKGTLLAILITGVVYAVIAVILGCVQVRVASGNIVDFIGIANATRLNCTTAACQFGWLYNSVNTTCVDSASAVNQCFKGGLLNDFQAMQKISWFWPIIVAGIFAATLSSALASLVSAPKIFQAVCRDGIFPLIGFFGKGAPGTDEPRRGYVLAFVIALAFILIGELNAIAPIISNFFLASYTLINYSCFSASLAKSPGWRPAFRYYNMWLSLLGAVICCAIMFVVKWWAALITIVIVVGLYKYVDFKKPDVNWGSSTQAYTYTQALNHTLKLSSVDDHVKNFRPQLLVLTGTPKHRPALLDMASQITKNVSLMLCANVKQAQGKFPYRVQLKENDLNQKWLKSQHFKALYSSVVSGSLTEGVLTLLQLGGLGKLRTNTLMMGFKCDWKSSTPEAIIGYINIIHHALDMNYGVCILRMKEGLDVSQYLGDGDKPAQVVAKLDSSSGKIESSVGDSGELIPASSKDDEGQIEEKGSSNKLVSRGSMCDVNAAKIKAATQFQSIQQKGKTIDVWWLFDDGGLTILIPYLLSTKHQWSGCRMRIFTGGKKERIDQDKRTMAQLLSKFRISFEDVIVIGDINVKPNKSATQDFETMIKPWRQSEGSNEANESWRITDNELATLKEKTNRQLRLQELLQKHSRDAALIFMTMPMARKGSVSAALYMAWLEELTKNLPPIVLLRGNQTSVLTFYS